MPNNQQGGGGFFTGAGGAILGMLGGAIGAGHQHRRQRELMELQQQHQMALNRQGHELQHEMWKKTSYPAQLAMMKQAGLSPGLMYGGGAGTGGSTGSQGGGSAAGGSAAAFQPMDMSNMMMMDAQRKLIDAQSDDLEAGARLKEVEADKKAGVDTEEGRARIAKLISEKEGIDMNIVKTAQEVTNLKTLDDWNKLKMDLDKLKLNKQVTGSAVVDLLSQVGLDPTRNETDQWILRGMLVAWYGADVLTKLSKVFPKAIADKFMAWFGIKPNKVPGFKRHSKY